MKARKSSTRQQQLDQFSLRRSQRKDARERELWHGDGTRQRGATRITPMIDGFRAGAPPYSSGQDGSEARTIAEHMGVVWLCWLPTCACDADVNNDTSSALQKI